MGSPPSASTPTAGPEPGPPPGDGGDGDGGDGGYDRVLAALADPTRWQVLTLLADRGDGTASSLARALPVSRPAVIKHLAALDRAGLVSSRRVGREVRYAPRPDRLRDTAHWMAGLASTWTTRLDRLKRLAETEEPGRPSP